MKKQKKVSTDILKLTLLTVELTIFRKRSTSLRRQMEAFYVTTLSPYRVRWKVEFRPTFSRHPRSRFCLRVQVSLEVLLIFWT